MRKALLALLLAGAASLALAATSEKSHAAPALAALKGPHVAPAVTRVDYYHHRYRGYYRRPVVRDYYYYAPRTYYAAPAYAPPAVIYYPPPVVYYPPPVVYRAYPPAYGYGGPGPAYYGAYSD